MKQETQDNTSIAMVAIIARMVVLMLDLTFMRWATMFVMETNNRFIMLWV